MVPETEKIDFKPIEIPQVRRSFSGYREDRPRRCWRLAARRGPGRAAIVPPCFCGHRRMPLDFVEIDRGDVDIVVVEHGTVESANNTTVRCQVEALIGTVGGAQGGTSKGSGASGGGSGQASGSGGAGGAQGSRGSGGSGQGGREQQAARARPRKKPGLRLHLEVGERLEQWLESAGRSAGRRLVRLPAGRLVVIGFVVDGFRRRFECGRVWLGSGGVVRLGDSVRRSRSFAVSPTRWPRTRRCVPSLPRPPTRRPRKRASRARWWWRRRRRSAAAGRRRWRRRWRHGWDGRKARLDPHSRDPSGRKPRQGRRRRRQARRAAYEDEEQAQKIRYLQAKSYVEQANSLLEVAQITLKEYRDGIYPQDLQLVRQYIQTCQLEKDRLGAKSRMVAGHAEKRASALPFRSTVIGSHYEQSKIALAEAQGMLDRLVKQTGPKIIKSLEANVRAIKSDKLTQDASFSLEDQRLKRIRKNIEHCIVRAPGDGIVVYVNQADRWGTVTAPIDEGVTLRQDQPIFSLPDPKHMRVKARVNESKVTMIHTGQRVLVTVDAFPDRPLRGTVGEVTAINTPLNASDVRIYYANVEIDQGFDDLRPGLSAGVHVPCRFAPGRDPRSARVGPLGRRKGVCRCLRSRVRPGPRSNSWRWRAIELGLSDAQFAEVTRGLQVGDRIVSIPRACPHRPPKPSMRRPPMSLRCLPKRPNDCDIERFSSRVTTGPSADGALRVADLSEHLGQSLRLSLAVDAGQRRVPCARRGRRARPRYSMHDFHMGYPRYGRADRQQVVVICRPLELAADVDDHQEMARVFDFAIRDPAAGGASRSGPSRSR